MKILHIVQYCFDDFPGGIQRYVKDLSSMQVSDGCSVEIFCSGKKNKSKQEKPLVHKFSSFSIFRTPICIGMIKKFLSCKCEIVHIHAQFPLTGELIAFLCRLKKIPVVTTYHNEPYLSNRGVIGNVLRIFWERFLVMILLHCSDKIIVTTKEFFSSSRVLKKDEKKENIYPF
ncbi:MAG: glycosyltransferase, partial [Candidatus Bathyarchaeia archaeon]